MTSASEMQADAARAYTDLGEQVKRLEARRNNAVEFLKRSLAGAKKLNDPGYGLSITWTPWSKTEDVTDWHPIAQAYRRLLDAQVVGVPDLTDAEKALARRLDPDGLDAIESLYTRPVTKTGEAWRVTWKDAQQAPEED